VGDRYLYDSLSTAEGGINSLLSPQLLPRNTLAWSVNATIRGGYIQPRPPLFQQTITYPSDSVRSAVEGGYFQGAGYYRPDYGSQQLVAQISGRLFTFTPQSADTWLCAEITIPGDPNSSTATQAWMNQAEKWMIITDGTAKLPIFYDGTTTRRSYGPSVVLATTQAIGTFPSPRVIGEIITVELTAPYTGPFNVPVLFNGEFYQPIEGGGGGGGASYTAILTNLTDVPGATIPSGSSIVVKTNSLAVVLSDVTVVWGNSITVPVSTTFGISVGMTIVVTHLGVITSCGTSPEAFTVTAVNTATNEITISTVGSSGCPRGIGTQTIYAIGPFTGQPTIISRAGVAPPDVVVAVTSLDFTAPAVGANVTATITQPYTGAAGQTVWIGSKQYSIQSGSTPPTLGTANLS